jgi:hypothetical protein
MQQFLLFKRRKIMGGGVSKSSGPTGGPNDPNNPNNPNANPAKDPNLAEYDTNGDGKIDYNEWMAMPPTIQDQYEQDMKYPDKGYYKKKSST